MRRMTAWIIACLIVSTALDAQMYDPFRKAARPKNANPSSALLPPPPMLAAPQPATVTLVSAVMNDKAFINGAWYRVGDKVNDREVAYIQNRFVGLREGNRLVVFGVGATRPVLRAKDLP